jgi:cation:H+ antiporter
MIDHFLLLAVGLVLVVKGADFLVEGASALARRLAVAEIVIGLTVVAFGTSAPELVVNAFSSLGGKNELVLGNIIGSNIFNTLLILGIAGLIYPLNVQRNSVLKEIPYSMFAVVVFYFLANDFLFAGSGVVENVVSRWDGVVLLVLFVVFMLYAFVLSKTKVDSDDDGEEVCSWLKTWVYILLGIAGLFWGGKLTVDNAVEIARDLSVSDKLIGLTIVSLGTSLPELATSAVAAYKKRCDLAVGNIVGSNIFNILLVMGVSAVIAPVGYPVELNIDVYVFAGGTVVLFIAMFTGKKRKLDRKEAFVLLTGYVFYMVYIILRK